MNILIVTAHPSSKGRTHLIAETYAQAKRSRGHTVTVVDLYDKANMPPYMAFEKIKDRPLEKVQKKFQDQLLAADEIVVVHPIWWGMPPAIMKNWVEQTFWPGVAYKYLPNGKVQKLLTGKTAKIFATSGGSSWYYHLYILPLLSFWKLCVFGFCGADVIDLQVCGNLDKWRNDEEKCAKCIKAFLKKVKASALS